MIKSQLILKMWGRQALATLLENRLSRVKGAYARFCCLVRVRMADPPRRAEAGLNHAIASAARGVLSGVVCVRSVDTVARGAEGSISHESVGLRVCFCGRPRVFCALAKEQLPRPSPRFKTIFSATWLGRSVSWRTLTRKAGRWKSNANLTDNACVCRHGIAFQGFVGRIRCLRRRCSTRTDRAVAG